MGSYQYGMRSAALSPAPAAVLTTLARIIPAAMLLCCLSVASSARAEVVAFEASRFEQPSGWERGAEAASGPWAVQRRFAPDRRGRDGGVAIIQIARPIPVSAGDAEALLARMTASFPELARARPSRADGITVNGHRLLHQTHCCGTRDGKRLGLEMVIITTDSRHHLLALVSLGLRGDARQQAREDFGALVRSFRPTQADRPFGLEPPKGAGGLHGVFTHQETGLRPNAFGGMDFIAESRILVLDGSGLFGRAIPPDNDLAAHCRAAPARCGIYRLLPENDRIEMTGVSGRLGMLRVRQEPFARQGDDIRIGRVLHRHIPPMPRGTTFDGTWRHFAASSGSGAFTSGGVASERTLTLTRDGRFHRTRWAGATFSSEVSGNRTGVGVSSRSPATSGRYEVEGYHLTLLGEDGQRERLTLIRPDPGSDRLLVINGGNYLRREQAN